MLQIKERQPSMAAIGKCGLIAMLLPGFTAMGDPPEPLPPTIPSIAHNVYCARNFSTGNKGSQVYSQTQRIGPVQCYKDTVVQMVRHRERLAFETINWSNQPVHYLELTLNSGSTFLDFVGAGPVDMAKSGM